MLAPKGTLVFVALAIISELYIPVGNFLQLGVAHFLLLLQSWTTRDHSSPLRGMCGAQQNALCIQRGQGWSISYCGVQKPLAIKILGVTVTLELIHIRRIKQTSETIPYRLCMTRSVHIVSPSGTQSSVTDGTTTTYRWLQWGLHSFDKYCNQLLG